MLPLRIRHRSLGKTPARRNRAEAASSYGLPRKPAKRYNEPYGESFSARDSLLANYSRSMDEDGDEIERLRQRLAELKSEHRDLDDVIARISDTAPFDQIQVKRLKKRKLMLKDQIAKMESNLLPDIIA